ncbi:RNA-binding protein [Phenylobacterium sp. NIBR 498073]|uniref:RNA-binding protein n=1 Tax=Phenylobacterium sp. NIBR 498073 TaxID=3015177 RepID=UPI0022B5475E|nr:RNA-binding protein [Phenylobacterium sp. NIBR 498073]WGU40282.1 RNA-binding protein [Phenylobacterium sp. NIBR 498073]
MSAPASITAGTKAPRTLAQVARERRDIVSGQVMDEGALVRFVAGPGGLVVPDLARKLPGRGLWVAADRASVETAVKKGAFSRAAKAKLAASADLADQVESLLRRRLLDGLGLAKRAGELISGFEKVASTLNAGKAAWLIEASDGAADGRRKILNVARKSPKPPQLCGLFDAEELGLALGAENVIHTAFLAGRGADRWTNDVRRLSGFRPLLPESWREEKPPEAGGT